MSITGPRHGSQRRIYMPYTRESTYGEGDTVFSVVFNTRRATGTALRTKSMTILDDEMATGDEFGVQQIHLGVDFPSTEIPLFLSPEALGLFGAFAMGADSKATANGSTLHTLGMAALSDGYPGSFGIEEHLAGSDDDSSSDFNLKGCVVDSWTIRGSREGLVEFDVAVSGNGDRGGTGDKTESGMVVAGRDSCWFPAAAVRVGIKAVATEHEPGTEAYAKPDTSFTHTFVTTGNGYTLLGPMLESWSITYANEWGIRRAAGMSSSAGLIGMCPVWVRRRVTASLTFVQSSGFDSFTQAILSGTSANNIEYALAVEGVSDFDLATNLYAGFAIQIPVAALDNTADGTFSEINTDTITLTAKKDKGADDYDPIRVIVHDDRDQEYAA